MFPPPESSSEIVSGSYGSEQLVYSVFSTPDNSLPGSAICVFSVRQIQEAFEGRFKHQRENNYNWMPLPQSEASFQ